MMLLPDYTPLEITMIKKGKTRIDLKEEMGLSSATVAKITKKEWISLKTVAQLCEFFNCEISDVVTFRKSEG